jgi:hypothetical protein
VTPNGYILDVLERVTPSLPAARAAGQVEPDDISMLALLAKAAHPALVTKQDFVATQQIRAARPASDGRTHQFALVGLP